MVSVTAQNLVPNPGFEIYETCPDSYTNRAPRQLVPHWRIPTRGTTDYYNSCSRFNVGVPMNMMGNCFAAEGVAYAGMILLEHPEKAEQGERPVNYREYLQAKLENPLERDSTYRVSCSFAFAGHSLYIAPVLGVHFSEKRISRRRVRQANPQLGMDTACFEYEKEIWYEWVDTLTASGGEEYLTLGLSEARDRFERQFLLAKLREHGFNISRTAQELGVYPSNLHAKIRKFGIEVER